MPSTKQYLIGAIMLILLFLIYSRYKYTNDSYEDIYRELEHTEKVLTLMGVDLHAENLVNIKRTIGDIDNLFTNILNEDQIERLKRRELNEVDFFEKYGLEDGIALHEHMILTMDSLNDLFVSDLFAKHLAIFYKSIIVNYNRTVSLDSVSIHVASWMEENVTIED